MYSLLECGAVLLCSRHFVQSGAFPQRNSLICIELHFDKGEMSWLENIRAAQAEK
jgi:hypothetical protein